MLCYYLLTTSFPAYQKRCLAFAVGNSFENVAQEDLLTTKKSVAAMVVESPGGVKWLKSFALSSFTFFLLYGRTRKSSSFDSCPYFGRSGGKTSPLALAHILFTTTKLAMCFLRCLFQLYICVKKRFFVANSQVNSKPRAFGFLLGYGHPCEKILLNACILRKVFVDKMPPWGPKFQCTKMFRKKGRNFEAITCNVH